MFNVYDQHRGTTIVLPPERDVGAVHRLADAAASLGHNAFYRVFRVTPTGEQFETAFSVLGGVVREHRDVTFPDAHF